VSRRFPGWLLPAGLGVVVIGLVTIALTRGPVTLDPNSPEGTVQEYLLAISESRWDDAVAVIHDDWRGSCEGFDLRAFAPGDFSAELGASNPPLGFVESVEPSNEGAPTMPENTTRVDVTINHQDGGGLGSSWEEQVAFEVTFDGDFWWIVGDPWPYFVFSCPGQ
jgi:hypothetical protein